MQTLFSPRLILRQWQQVDRGAFAAICADPQAMEFLLPLPTVDDSNGWIDRQIAHQSTHGFCFWALEDKTTGDFIGTAGLVRIGYDAHFTPAVEIGWRIARKFWGKGYAPEAARAALAFGFRQLKLDEIVATTVAANVKSRRIMAKLGMTHDAADDFDYPRVPDGHPLKSVMLYRLSREQWMKDQR
ncbi:GNAT family N-acetyltransferase [Brenneria tiliae]|uniref:GNAT family N-acetyltransferase n=1 Tax=Brenneria tiliae TaxID=2914984 RepID=UPI0020150033|nr:GNAT family N-acetyltransferase [Brenneria tiliae]MCL2896736.1 GNAT family N-acetyltransferase [Brenneria tiliae]MCL2901281.1 GNAT family N-acetyltransferase [Brenneria tiliae]